MPSLSAAASKPKMKTPGESILFGFDFTRLLVGTEVISSATSVTCIAAEQTITDGAAVATSDLSGGTISGAKNSSTFDNDEGGTVAVNCGVQARITGGVDGGDYTIRCRVATDASNTRDIIGTLQVRDS